MPKKSAPTFSTRMNPRTKLGIMAIVILVLVLIFGKMFSFVQSLYEPLNADISLTKKNYSWDGKYNINVLLKGEDIALLSYNPTEKKVTIIPIPSQTYIDVPGGFGKWQIGSVYALGQAEAVSIGPKLLKLSTTSMLGLPVDGFIDSSSLKDANTSEGFVKLMREDFLGFIASLSDLKSDLTLMEVWSLKMAMSGVRFDKIETWNLEEQDLFTSKSLEDGSWVLIPNTAAIDTLVQGLADSVFTSNRVNIAVFNSTSAPGLAQKGARIISSLGGNVVMVSNATVPQKKSYIALKENPSPEIVTRISQIFDLDCSDSPECSILVCTLGALENACPTDDIEVTHSRTEITVVLGEDFYQSYK